MFSEEGVPLSVVRFPKQVQQRRPLSYRMKEAEGMLDKLSCIKTPIVTW